MGTIIQAGEEFGVPGVATPGASALLLDAYAHEDAFTVYSRATQYVHMQQTNEAFLFGNRQYTFVEDFYFRVYLIPTVLDFGVITSDKLITGAVWNAFLDPINMTAATFTIGTEVTMGNPARPVSFGGLQLINFPFIATKAGETILQDFLTLTFDSGDEPIWPIVGFRPPPPDDLVFPFPPSWDGGYTVEFEYHTDIIESENGNEQRRQNRQNPRRNTTFTTHLQNNLARVRFNKLMTRMKNNFFIPELPRYVTSTSAMPAAGLTVEVQELPWWLAQGGRVMFNDLQGNFGVRIIDSVLQDSNSAPDSWTLTFTESANEDWPEGSRIHPAILGIFPEELNVSAKTNWVETVQVDHRGLPGFELPLPVTQPVETFYGRELFSKKPNWATEPSLTMVWPREFMDFTVGRIETLLSRDYSKVRTQMSFAVGSVDEADELFFFFVRMAGRCGEFFMPSWAEDLELAEDLIETENRVLVVGGTDFLDAYENDRTRAAIMIEKDDGTLHLFSLSDIERIEDSNSADDPQAYLVSTSLWGESIALADIERVMWVNLCRFSTDQMTFNWLTNEVCTVQFTVEELPRVAPDDLTVEDSNS